MSVCLIFEVAISQFFSLGRLNFMKVFLPYKYNFGTFTKFHPKLIYNVQCCVKTTLEHFFVKCVVENLRDYLMLSHNLD